MEFIGSSRIVEISGLVQSAVSRRFDSDVWVER